MFSGSFPTCRTYHLPESGKDVVQFELEDFIAQREKMVVLGRFTMRVKSTGKLSRSEDIARLDTLIGLLYQFGIRLFAQVFSLHALALR